MACHEVAALRLGLMKIIGIVDEAEKQHEINEIGKERMTQPGPIKSLTEAENLNSLKRFYDSALVDLEKKVALTKPDDPKLGYYRSLLVLTKKVELDLRNSVANFETLYRDLDEVHDFVHEIFPAN